MKENEGFPIEIKEGLVVTSREHLYETRQECVSEMVRHLDDTRKFQELARIYEALVEASCRA